MRILVLVIVIALPSFASAAEYFVCDCVAGADAACVAGRDVNSGDDPASAWRSYERARQAFAQIAPGDAIRFCRGGAFELGSEVRWVNSSCRRDARCTVGAYTPSWAEADTERPILWQPNDASGFALEDGGDAEHEEGYVFADLRLLSVAGREGNGAGFFIYNDTDDVLIDNVMISGFSIGVHVGGSNRCGPDPKCDGRNSRVVLQNSTVVQNHHQGWLGSSDGSRIMANRFVANGSTPQLDHNIYLSESGAPSSGMRVIGNYLTGSALSKNGGCASVSLVVHGNQNDLRIEANQIREDSSKASDSCWGIAVDPAYSSSEGFTQVVIRGNHVVGVGNVGIGLSACQDCVVENNIIRISQAFALRGIAVGYRSGGVGDLELERLRIRNNSVYVGGRASGSVGIEVGGEGEGHQVISNAVYYRGRGSKWSCFGGVRGAAAFTAFDNNLCVFPRAQASAVWIEGADLGRLARSAWKQRSGFDGHSKDVGPRGTGRHARLRALTSNSAQAPVVDSGHPSLSAKAAYGGWLRDARPDIGAREWGANPCRATQRVSRGGGHARKAAGVYARPPRADFRRRHSVAAPLRPAAVVRRLSCRASRYPLPSR